jgi:DNA-binding XRE family transcriptional regulator
MNQKLRDARIQRGLTQERLARSADLLVRAYHAYEHGSRTPSVVVAVRIADVLQCDVRDLFGEAQEGSIPAKTHLPDTG